MKPNWDDLRYALAIAREGSLAGAARTLLVNHSTVFRRLNGLEERFGTKLFERHASGYRPTSSGAQLLEAAERIEAEVVDVDRELSGRDARLSGSLRVTSSETLAFRILTEAISKFLIEHPDIKIEITIENRALDLSRREADVALRAARPRQPDLFGRKIAQIDWAIYASTAYLAKHGAPTIDGDLSEHRWIGWAQDTQTIKAADWISKNVSHEAIVYRTSSIINQLVAGRDGIGLAVLPRYVGEPEPELRKVLKPVPPIVTELWLITHKSLTGTARVRAFMDFIGRGIISTLPLMIGEQAGRSKRQRQD